ncbi:MAG: hypothetical protein AAFO76_11425 [Cyanobacteria bacterium J06607_15]
MSLYIFTLPLIPDRNQALRRNAIAKLENYLKPEAKPLLLAFFDLFY